MARLDIAGAGAAGMKTLLVTRSGVSALPTAPPPTVSVPDFMRLSEELATI